MYFILQYSKCYLSIQYVWMDDKFCWMTFFVSSTNKLPCSLKEQLHPNVSGCTFSGWACHTATFYHDPWRHMHTFSEEMNRWHVTFSSKAKMLGGVEVTHMTLTQETGVLVLFETKPLLYHLSTLTERHQTSAIFCSYSKCNRSPKCNNKEQVGLLVSLLIFANEHGVFPDVWVI